MVATGFHWPYSQTVQCLTKVALAWAIATKNRDGSIYEDSIRVVTTADLYALRGKHLEDRPLLGDQHWQEHCLAKLSLYCWLRCE